MSDVFPVSMRGSGGSIGKDEKKEKEEKKEKDEKSREPKEDAWESTNQEDDEINSNEFLTKVRFIMVLQ